tara:strand:+ start:3669 stop:4433 length:765 start_codon:yes stop_codon:yes gene_type:complete
MIYTIKLSAENLNLSKFEVETLFNTKCKRRAKFLTCDLRQSNKKLEEILEKSALIKQFWKNDIKLWEVQGGRFKDREPTQRPAFHPTGMKPKLARILVNLTGAKRQVLDPFCGTGAILIEAGTNGLKVIGSDYDSRMIQRTKTNLKHFKIKPTRLEKIDATKLSEHFKKNSVEAIVCDPPYGQSSSTSDKNIRTLYKTFLAEAYKILKSKGRVVVIVPSKISIRNLAPKKFKKLGKFDWYVHRSLTRQILILEK